MNGSVAYKRRRKGHTSVADVSAVDDMWCCRAADGVWWFTDPEHRGQSQGWARSTEATATPWQATRWMEYHAGGGWRSKGSIGMNVVATGGVDVHAVRLAEMFHQVHQ